MAFFGIDPGPFARSALIASTYAFVGKSSAFSHASTVACSTPSAPASSFAVHASSLRSALISSGVTTPFDSTWAGRVVSSMVAARVGAASFAMRRIFVSVLLAAACACTALAGGCSGGKNGNAADAAADSYGVQVTGDGAGGDEEGGEGDSGPTEQTTMRLAHASPDLGAVDFCWRQSGNASFTGPVLGGDLPPPEAGPPMTEGSADAAAGETGPGDASDAWNEASTLETGTPDAAMPAELVFGSVSPDVLLPAAGTFDIAVVPAGQTSCTKHRLVGTVTLDAGKRATVVLMGVAEQDSGPDALGVVAFTDAPINPQTARVRLIHAALGANSEPATGPLSVKAGTTVIASEIDARMTSAPSTSPAIDALGYATLPPFQPPTALELATLGDVAATHWTTAASDLTVQTGTSHTGIIVTFGQGALGIAWCGDAPTNRGAATCAVLLAQP